jgi:ribonuclease III
MPGWLGGLMYNNLESLKKNLGELEEVIRYDFNRKQNLILAMTHSSYANENKAERLKSNERLEFLGDSILSLVISENLYVKHTDLAEGEMTKVRASIVCEPSLVKCANSIALGRFLMLGKGEELTGGRVRTSILSDAFEALIGAIYIDGGMECAKAFILEQMRPLIEDTVKGLVFIDYKTQLQEVIQKNTERKISYHILDEKGPDHNKIFVSQVKLQDQVIGTGEGKSKKEAEQNAAKLALIQLGEIHGR